MDNFSIYDFPSTGQSECKNSGRYGGIEIIANMNLELDSNVDYSCCIMVETKANIKCQKRPLEINNKPFSSENGAVRGLITPTKNLMEP